MSIYSNNGPLRRINRS